MEFLTVVLAVTAEFTGRSRMTEKVYMPVPIDNSCLEAQRKLNVVIRKFNDACNDSDDPVGTLMIMKEMAKIYSELKHLLEPSSG